MVIICGGFGLGGCFGSDDDSSKDKDGDKKANDN